MCNSSSYESQHDEWFWNRFRYRIGKVRAVDEELKGAGFHGVSIAAVKHEKPVIVKASEGTKELARLVPVRLILKGGLK